MGLGIDCPKCGRPMFAQTERWMEGPEGRTDKGGDYTYVCINGNYEETGEPCGYQKTVYEERIEK